MVEWKTALGGLLIAGGVGFVAYERGYKAPVDTYYSQFSTQLQQTIQTIEASSPIYNTQLEALSVLAALAGAYLLLKD